MIIINESLDIFDNNDISFLEEICQNFKASEVPQMKGDYLNYFYRQYIQLDDERAVNIIKRSEEYTNRMLNRKFNEIKIAGLWINQIDINSNRDDEFHKDNSIASLIVYLNDDYSGGEFEYVDMDSQNKIKIQPKKGSSLLMNDRLAHRVLPVTSGVRYSLVSFYVYDSKINKTLI